MLLGSTIAGALTALADLRFPPAPRLDGHVEATEAGVRAAELSLLAGRTPTP